MTGITSHLMRAIAATGAILATEVVHLSSNDWVLMVERLGLAVALVLFFVWTGWKREQRMAKRLDWLEKENDKLTIRVTALTEQVNQTLSEGNKVIAAAMQTLAHRTCFAFPNRDEFEKWMQEREDTRG